jgi:hypothetical protein
MTMTIYYVSKKLVITERAMIIRRTPEVRIPVADLHPVRAERHVTAVPGRRPPLIHLAGGALALVAITGPVLDSPAVLVSAVLTVFTAAAVAGIRRRARTTAWELWATYREAEICLYRTASEREFNQIKRALLRALEANRRW